MEVSVSQLVHAATEVLAVRYSGDPAAARLLVQHGWMDGADQGFGRDNAGQNILRGLVGDRVVFPGDVIVLHPDWTREVYEYELFLERYEEPDEIQVLTDGQDAPPVDWDQFLPTGHNPDAVLLEPPPAAAPPTGGTGMQTSYPAGGGEEVGAGTSAEVSRDSVPSDAEAGTAPTQPDPQTVDDEDDDEDEEEDEG